MRTQYTHGYGPNNFDCYIIGYLVATHIITYTITFTEPNQYKALNKGLQPHSTVKGNLKITVSSGSEDAIPTILEEIINITNHVPITFNFNPRAQNRSIHDVKILLNQIISEFKSLQKLLINYVLLNSSTPLGHPLLNLTQLNELTLQINCSHKNDLELLKKLTTCNATCDKPLRKLTVKCYEYYNKLDFNILNLTKNQSSLEELRIVSFISHNIEDLMATVWYKGNNSLKVSCEYLYQHPTFEYMYNQVMRELNESDISSAMEIQLTSFTTIIKFYNHNIDFEKQSNVYLNITIYSEPVNSELRSFLNVFKKSLLSVELVPTDTTVRRCHKIQLNSFIYGVRVQLKYPRI